MNSPIVIGKFVKESFTVAYALKWPNGLVLRTYTKPPLEWAGAEKNAEVAQQFLDIVASLEAAGFEIIDEEGIREECQERASNETF